MQLVDAVDTSPRRWSRPLLDRAARAIAGAVLCDDVVDSGRQPRARQSIAKLDVAGTVAVFADDVHVCVASLAEQRVDLVPELPLDVDLELWDLGRRRARGQVVGERRLGQLKRLKTRARVSVAQ